MNYLANIYTKSKIDIEPFFNIVDDENKLIDGIPTLIIGWDSVKSLYGDINILDKKVKDNKVQDVLDKINDKFGDTCVTIASLKNKN